jgi:hypothetical protein
LCDGIGSQQNACTQYHTEKEKTPGIGAHNATGDMRRY